MPAHLRAAAATCAAIVRAFLLVARGRAARGARARPRHRRQRRLRLRLSRRRDDGLRGRGPTLLAAQRHGLRRQPTCSVPASRSARRRWSRRRWSSPGRCRRSRCWPRCPTAGRPRLDGLAGRASRRWSRRSPRPARSGAGRRCAGTGVRSAAAWGACGRGACSALLAVRRGRRGRAGPDAGRRAASRSTCWSTPSPRFGIGGLVGGLVMTWWQRRARCAAPPRAAGVRLVVLVSGSGTNLQALLDACADPAYGAEVVAVGADRDGIEGLARAERAGVPTFVRRVARLRRPRGVGPGAGRRGGRAPSPTWSSPPAS